MNRSKKNWLDYGSIIALGGACLILVILNIGWGDHWLDSDMAAEMIFSKLLSEEGKWIATTDWYYSTEFRVLYTQIIMGALHRVCSDWHVIRVITNIVFYGLLFGSFCFVCKPLGVRKRNVYLCALALFVPVSEAVMTHLQMGNTYMSHVILCFLTFGLFLRLSDTKCTGRRWMLYAVCYGSLCVILGVSGVRYMLDLLIPCALTALIYWGCSQSFKKFRRTPSFLQLRCCFQTIRVKYLYTAVAGAGMGCIGYLLNIVFVSKKYQFQTYDTTNFIKIYGNDGVFLERVQNVIGQLLQMFGYIFDKSFLSLRGLVTMAAFVMIAVLAFVWWRSMQEVKAQNSDTQEDGLDANRNITVWFAGISLALHLFVFIFTTSTMVDRYFIPIAIFFLLVLAIYMEREALVFDRVAVCFLLGVCLSLAGVKTYFSFLTNDKNASRYEMAAYLVEEGYTFGYASYWNSNIMTELSDGALEMANLWSLESLGDFKWSSKMSSYEEKEGKVFLIAGTDEIAALQHHGMLEQQQVIFENEDYIVLHFENQEQFLRYRE